jgi:hypothetical protein
LRLKLPSLVKNSYTFSWDCPFKNRKLKNVAATKSVALCVILYTTVKGIYLYNNIIKIYFDYAAAFSNCVGTSPVYFFVL